MKRILIANRGEIARRIIATAHRLGLQTVAVYSEPDADSLHVRDADLAVALPGATSVETYLDTEAILEAARVAGADAIHPGYGFASESAEFAEAVEAAGLVWIGPTAHSIRQMAYKVEAKELAAEAGVPLVPGAELPDDLDDEQILQRAQAVGFPLLIKASAGGGGKGMRVVDVAEDVLEAVAAARREARSAFGDGTVFCERFLQPSRHVEVQVFGDQHGRVVHLFERECSIQRRHQKIVEEAPATALTVRTAERMHSAATSLARVIGYVGAGTVEFLVVDSPEGEQEFFFLEMNTRLQVEHPVTEAITGLDLVEWQIRVARGEALPLTQGEITRHGHAIEVRLYAEDPARGYLPNTGRLSRFSLAATDFFTPHSGGVRLDSGVASGSEISPYYDPMLAKVIAHAPDRVTAADVLTRTLATAQIAGVATNRVSLAAICGSPEFARGETTTDFLDRHPALLDPPIDRTVIDRHLIAAVVAASAGHDVPAGWSTVPMPAQIDRFATADGRRHVTLATRWRPRGDVLHLEVSVHEGDGSSEVDPYADEGRNVGTVSARIVDNDVDVDVDVDADADADTVSVEVGVDGVSALVKVFRDAEVVCASDGEWSTQWRCRSAFGDQTADEGARGPSTPVPGTVTMVHVAAGDRVEAGDPLVVLEAMKMEHRIDADVSGIIDEVRVEVGQSVDAHTVVVVLTPADDVVEEST